MDSLLDTFNDQSEQSGFAPQDISSYKPIAILGYIFSILFFVIYLCNNSSSYCRFHANQQLAFFLLKIVYAITFVILGLIPGVGFVLGSIVGIMMFCVMVFLIIGVVKDKAIKLPPIGSVLKAF